MISKLKLKLKLKITLTNIDQFDSDRHDSYITYYINKLSRRNCFRCVARLNYMQKAFYNTIVKELR